MPALGDVLASGTLLGNLQNNSSEGPINGRQLGNLEKWIDDATGSHSIVRVRAVNSVKVSRQP
jgi:hypothetical protein